MVSHIELESPEWQAELFAIQFIDRVEIVNVEQWNPFIDVIRELAADRAQICATKRPSW